MRHAILSDVHANAFALRAALDDASEEKADSIACLGDLVGYHAQPHEVIAQIRALGIVTVLGNHDRMAITGDPPTGGPLARAAMHWTRRVLSEDETGFLAALPMERRLGVDALLVHAVPENIDSRLLAVEDFVGAAARLRVTHRQIRICFTGHTHIAGLVHIAPGGTATECGATTTTLDPDGGTWFANPGSVGLPRDGADGARYLIYDDETRTVSFHCASYEFEMINAVDRSCGLHTRLPEPLRTGAVTPATTIAIRRWLSEWI